MQPTKRTAKFAVVIPAYNEAATIRDIATRALALANLVIIVDDGSTDATVAELDGLPITLIRHPDNQGKAASLWDGIMAARQHEVEVIITLDGDGQHAPEDIPLLLAKYQHFPDHIIIGARLADKAAIPAKRYYANRIANFWIAWAAGYPITDSQSGFRLYPVELFDGLHMRIDRRSSFVFESEILIKAAHKHIFSQPVPIPAIYAANARPSHFRGVRDITFITIMVAKNLLRRMLFLPGLYRSAIKPHLPQLADKSIDTDGLAMLLLSTLLMFLTGGLSLLASLFYTISQALIAHSDVSDNKLLLVFGKQLVNEQPDSEYQARLQRAVSLLQAYPDSRVLLLGGYTSNATISESAAGRSYLLRCGISAERVEIEDDSHNTLENIKEARKHIDKDCTEVALISNRYHLARVCVMARGFGLWVHACAAEDILKLNPAMMLKLILETIYLHWYLTGKYWARLTQNNRMLDRIS